MKHWKFAVPAVALALLLIPCHAKDKNKKAVPAAFGAARYVYVEAMDGDEFNPNLIPEDRQAIENVWKALHKWNRYVLTVNPQDADLVFIVRKGRVASLRGMVGTPGMGRPRPTGPGTGPGPAGPAVGGGGEIGPPNDLLEVKMMLPSGEPGAQIWMRTERDGLDAPDVTLVQELKTVVDRDYPPEKP